MHRRFAVRALFAVDDLGARAAFVRSEDHGRLTVKTLPREVREDEDHESRDGPRPRAEQLQNDGDDGRAAHRIDSDILPLSAVQFQLKIFRILD